MTVTVTLTHIIALCAIVLPLGCTGIYWAVKMGVLNAILELENRIARDYVTKTECRQHREECQQHRAEIMSVRAN